MRQMPLYQKIGRIFKRGRSLFGRSVVENSIIFSAILLCFGIVVVIIVYSSLSMSSDEFIPGVFIEFNGMLFDIFVFGIVIALFSKNIERRREINRQQEIIDDYKKWNSDEAKLRIAGAIRRLNRQRVTRIDFGGIELTDFSFRRQDIKSIRGSTFYDGTWGEMGSRDNVRLENVDFSFVDCRYVVFSKFNPFSGISTDIAFASIRNCTFIEAELSDAVFKGAYIEWTTDHPSELGVWHDFDDSPSAFEQTYHPPFSNARLTGASFVDVRFKNGDFREAQGLLECDFTGALGLETCLFDNEEIKKSVLAMSRKRDGEK